MTTEQLNLLVSELLYQKKIESQADFSRKLGYKGRSYVSDMLSGKKEANIDNAVLKVFSEINPDWLRTGKGNVLTGTEKPASTDAGNQLLAELLKTQTGILQRLEEAAIQAKTDVKDVAGSLRRLSGIVVEIEDKSDALLVWVSENVGGLLNRKPQIVADEVRKIEGQLKAQREKDRLKSKGKQRTLQGQQAEGA